MSLRLRGIALLAFVSACSGSAGELTCPDQSQGTPGNCKIVCTNTSQCLLDEVCEQGLCTPISETDEIALTYLRAIPDVLPAGGGVVELEVISVNADNLNIMSNSPSLDSFVSQQVLGRIPLGRVTESVTLSVQARRGETLTEAREVSIQVDETANPPVITQFSANPFSLPPSGGAVIVTAEMENFLTAEISQAGQVIHRDNSMSPFQFPTDVFVNTTFELTVLGDGGTAVESFEVTVGEVRPDELEYDLQVVAPAIARPGDVVHLSWNKISGEEVQSLELEVGREGGGEPIRIGLPPRYYDSGRVSVALPPPAGLVNFTLVAQDMLTSVRQTQPQMIAPRGTLLINEAALEFSSRFARPGEAASFVWDVTTGITAGPTVFASFDGGPLTPFTSTGVRLLTAANQPTDIVLVTSFEGRQFGYAYDRLTPISQTPRDSTTNPVDLSVGGASGQIPQTSHQYILPVTAEDRLSVRLNGDCRGVQIAVLGPTGRAIPTTGDGANCPQVVAARVFGSGQVSIGVTSSDMMPGGDYGIVAWRRGPQSHRAFSDRYSATVVNALPVQPSNLVPLDTGTGGDIKFDLELPLAFPFFGQRHRSVTVHSSGYLSFGTTTLSPTLFEDSPDPAIALFAGEFSLGVGSVLLVGGTNAGGNSYAVVEFRDLIQDNGAVTVSGVVLLRDNGHIFVRYDRIEGEGVEFAAGVRGSFNQDARSHPRCANFQCNTSNMQAGLVLHYAPFDRPPMNP